MSKYTFDNLNPIIKESNTWADVCRKIGIKPMTGAQSYIKKIAIRLGINFNHFIGKSSRKGKTSGKRISVKKYLYNGSKITSHRLKILLIRDGLKEKCCEICGLYNWNGFNIPLELHHKNGNHNDNRLENLIIVCPNCHSLEPKYPNR